MEMLTTLSNIIQFGCEFRVLFNLPNDKVVHVHKSARNELEVDIKDGHGIAIVKATGKHRAANKVKQVFPSAEIIETKPL